ncbi:MAG TPA: iron-sulfur cluster repair di-iron protein [Ohtaekwangia sp.]|nr:iron-sulfur cluster repair di-iron protein [Ohtaekwangia sp.]
MISTEQNLDMDTISIADVAIAFPYALDILNEYHLDYCCGGKRLFTNACAKAGADPAEVWSKLNRTRDNRSGDSRMNFASWNVSLLIDFVVQHHHGYVRESIPRIQELMDKVCNAHGSDTPHLLTVRDNFNALADELLQHLPKEELILFPAMRRMFGDTPAEEERNVIVGGLNAPIDVMEDEHERAGQLVKEIRVLTQNYTVPEHACPTYRLAFLMLNQFDNDLMQHIHIENNILFPKALVASQLN